MARSYPSWIEILTPLSVDEIPARILSDLTHYRHGGAYESEDEGELKNALLAFRIIHLKAE